MAGEEPATDPPVDEAAAELPVDEAAADPPADEGTTEQKRWRPSFGPVSKAATVVGLVGGVVVLVFTFAPDLKPEKTPPATGKLELTAVNERATMREYLDAEGIPPGGLAQAVLSRLGVLTTIRYSATGLDGKTLPLSVKLTSPDTGRVACTHPYEVTPGKNASERTVRAWSALPTAPRPGETFNLHVTLFPPDGKPPSLDAGDRTGIKGLDQPQPGPPNRDLTLC